MQNAEKVLNKFLKLTFETVLKVQEYQWQIEFNLDANKAEYKDIGSQKISWKYESKSHLRLVLDAAQNI